MAQTLTAVNACDVVISLDNAAGTLTDISGSTNAVQISFTNAVGTYWRASSDHPVRYLLTQDMALNLTAVYSTTATEALSLLRAWATGSISGDDARTIRVDVPDSNAGSDRYQAEVLPAKFDFGLDSGAGETIMVSASFEPTGAYSVSQIS